jgi:flagellar motor switch protein FliN/FliY
MADDSQLVGQSEIEELLQQAKAAAQQVASTSAPNAAMPAGVARREGSDVGLPDGGGAAATSVASRSTNAVTAEAPLPGGPPSPESAASGNTASAVGDDIQFLLDQAEAAIASVDKPSPAASGLAPFPLRDFAGTPASQERATLDALSDVELDLKIELGRTHMQLEDVLKLRRGSVVALDKLAGDPVDVYVNGRLIARGEVLVLNDNFCVRVAELVVGDEAR